MEVTNRCWRSFEVSVRYSLIDEQGFELDYASAKLLVPSRDSGTSRGRILASPPGILQRSHGSAKITFGADD